ncbi:uncharacterized protein METZ01_LOCUS149750 [marine metagenome]|uniref:Uncharacterized protein n=1 Tax=marine metagenome TaxID=408172 RepID=A0A382A5U3_9ZZZZ
MFLQKLFASSLRSSSYLSNGPIYPPFATPNKKWARRNPLCQEVPVRLAQNWPSTFNWALSQKQKSHL